MNEMKIKLNNGLMMNVIAKIAKKVIFKKFGFKPEIKLNGISIEKIGSKIHLHLDVDADIREDDLLKITRLADEES